VVGVLRLILSPRWILWHLLTVGAMVTCGLLSAWQWGRAGSAMGSALNVGYGLQWPLFALFFGGMWFRLLRMELRALKDAPADADAAPETAGPDPVEPGAPGGDAVPDRDAGPSPFTSRPHAPAPITDETDPQLAAYNRMLAALAERDRARS
jgi:hypothetical protein